MILVIDNYDSFVYNLVQYVGSTGREVDVYRNDEISVDHVLALGPEKIIISPGPKRPEEAGISLELIDRMDGSIPLLGVCLGHQAIGRACGWEVIRAPELLHGKTSIIEHDATGLHRHISGPFRATRYHSLAIRPTANRGGLRINAWTPEGEIMGVVDERRRLHGVQYHPESWMTEHGMRIIQTFLDDA